MKGALASRARRRAISVLPTPVGPIIRMFFGVISARRLSATWPRRQRLRKAIATARFAAFWPTMCLSSSSTISRGVICDIESELLDGEIAIGVDADVGRDIERAFHDLPRRELGRLHQGQRGGLCVAAAGADGDEVVLGLDHIARARYHIQAGGIGNAQQSLEAAQAPIAPPVLRQLDRRPGEIAEFLELAFEALEQRESIRRAAGEPGEHFAAG